MKTIGLISILFLTGCPNFSEPATDAASQAVQSAVAVPEPGTVIMTVVGIACVVAGLMIVHIARRARRG